MQEAKTDPKSSDTKVTVDTKVTTYIYPVPHASWDLLPVPVPVPLWPYPLPVPLPRPEPCPMP